MEKKHNGSTKGTQQPAEGMRTEVDERTVPGKGEKNDKTLLQHEYITRDNKGL